VIHQLDNLTILGAGSSCGITKDVEKAMKLELVELGSLSKDTKGRVFCINCFDDFLNFRPF